MLENLQKYLSNSTTPEMTDLIVEAHSLFDRIALEGYERDFEELLAMDGNVDGGAVIDEVIGLTNDIQVMILREHGIIINDSADIQFANKLIRAVMDVQNTDDMDAIHRILESDLTILEAFAECMALVSDLEVEEVLLNVEFVSQSFLTALVELEPEEEEDTTDPEEASLIAACRGKMMRFLDYVKDTPLLAKEAFENNLPLALPYRSYAEAIAPAFATLTPDLAAKNLYLLALASRDGIGNPMKTIEESLEHYITSPDLITKIVVSLRQCSLEFTKYHELT